MIALTPADLPKNHAFQTYSIKTFNWSDNSCSFTPSMLIHNLFTSTAALIEAMFLSPVQASRRLSPLNLDSIYKFCTKSLLSLQLVSLLYLLASFHMLNPGKTSGFLLLLLLFFFSLNIFQILSNLWFVIRKHSDLFSWPGKEIVYNKRSFI